MKPILLLVTNEAASEQCRCERKCLDKQRGSANLNEALQEADLIVTQL